MIISVYDKNYLKTIESWIESEKEVFVVLLYAYAAGARDYIFIYDYEEFLALLDILPCLTWVIVFKEKQLCKRTFINEELINWAEKEFTEKKQFYCDNGLCVLVLERNVDFKLLKTNKRLLHVDELRDSFARFSIRVVSEDFNEFKEDIFQYWGKFVAVGTIPDHYVDDNDTMVSAKTPLPDGSVRPAPY